MLKKTNLLTLELLLAIAFSLMIVSCEEKETLPALDLKGTWQITSMDGSPVTKSTQLLIFDAETVQFDRTTPIAGEDIPLNEIFSGTYKTTNNTIIMTFDSNSGLTSWTISDAEINGDTLTGDNVVVLGDTSFDMCCIVAVKI